MKKILVICSLVVMIACHSNGSSKIDNKKLDNDANVQNVNGNIPDTTNSVDINSHKKDASDTVKDSSNK